MCQQVGSAVSWLVTSHMYSILRTTTPYGGLTLGRDCPVSSVSEGHRLEMTIDTVTVGATESGWGEQSSHALLFSSLISFRASFSFIKYFNKENDGQNTSNILGLRTTNGGLSSPSY